MSFNYTTVKTESLEEGNRAFLGYDVGGVRVGVLLNVRLLLTAPPDVPIRDNTVYLPGDTVSGLTGGMSGSPFTTLRVELLSGGVERTTRAYATPGGNVLVHDYTKVTMAISGKTRVTYTDEHFQVLVRATLSGTDIVNIV